MGCYDDVLEYGDIETLDAAVPTAFVDMAGDTSIRRRIHEHWADRLTQSIAVGGTHWQQVGPGGGLPGPRPTLFFAPAQAERRAAPPPAGLGPDGLQKALADAWAALMERVADPTAPWVTIQAVAGMPAIDRAWREQVDGSADPRIGVMLSP